jgi:hypothetical protein
MEFSLAFDWATFLKLTLAAVLGGIVGAERELNGHPAGLRTNILIAVSSCLFTILSINAFPLVGAAQDTARVAAQIVTGVGFLGAGAVIQTKKVVHGLTTAATIWMVAAVGGSRHRFVPHGRCNDDLDHRSALVPWPPQHLDGGKIGTPSTSTSGVIPAHR